MNLQEQQAHAWSLASDDAEYIRQASNGPWYEANSEGICIGKSLFKSELPIGWIWQGALQSRDEWEAMNKHGNAEEKAAIMKDEQWMPEVDQECEGLPVDTNDQWHKVIYVAPDPVKRGAKFYIGVYLGGERSGKVDYFKCFRPIQSEADKHREEQIGALIYTIVHSEHASADVVAKRMYDKGCRILSPDECAAKPLTDERKELLRKSFKHNATPYAAPIQAVDVLIDAVQNAIFGDK